MMIKEMCDSYTAPTYGRFDVVIKEGRGSVCCDENGKKYIDLGSGIGVNSLGYCNEEWQKAVVKQAGLLQHTSNLYYTEPMAELAKTLCERTGLCSVFFANSGAEANECAIKAARKYSFDKYGEGRNVIVTLKNSFHGRTLATVTATGQDGFHKFFGPFPEGFIYAPADNLPEALSIIEENRVCAVMFEPVQGEGGVLPVDADFANALYRYCAERDILVICDEVQTGNGRTGRLYGYMYYDFTPDMVTTAKGLGGGLPIGACMFGERVKDTLTPGTHGSTFGGNPVCAAGALAVLRQIDDMLLSEVTEKSEFIKSSLSGAPGIKSVTGLGLMLGLETVRPAGDIVKDCIDKGVLVLTAKNKVRLLPPLNIKKEQLASALDILKEVCAK